MPPTLHSVSFRLRSASLGFWVDVTLRDYAGRWLATAEISGVRELGLGATPRDALAGALSSLGPAATAALMADPQLLAASELLARDPHRN